MDERGFQNESISVIPPRKGTSLKHLASKQCSSLLILNIWLGIVLSCGINILNVGLLLQKNNYNHLGDVKRGISIGVLDDSVGTRSQEIGKKAHESRTFGDSNPSHESWSQGGANSCISKTCRIWF